MGIVLYDDQEEVLEKLREGFRGGHRSQILYSPTGGGKTEMGLSMMQASAAIGKRSSFIADRIVLVEQTSKRLDKYGIPHGVLQAGHWRRREHEQIQVCSAQTLEKMGAIPGTNLLVNDECHTQREMICEIIRNSPKMFAVGLSASPFTDGLLKTYTRVVSSTTTAKLVAKGRLVPLKIFIAKEADMTGVKRVAGEWTKDEAGKRGSIIVGDVAREWEKKTMEHFGRPRKTIVFCANVAHGALLAEQFADMGYNFIPISYKGDKAYNMEAIEDFSRAETQINGLIACDILTKGFDVPDVMIGVSARPFAKSFSSHVQQMGRVMRSAKPEDFPQANKEFGLWIDHSGNYLRFEEEWDDLYENGVKELKDGAEETKREKSELEKKQRTCPMCKGLMNGAGDTCPHCGWTRPFTELLTMRQGIVEEHQARQPKDKTASREDQQQWLNELAGYAAERNKEWGWIAHKFKQKFKDWPPRDMQRNPCPAGAEVKSFIQSQNIRFAMGKKSGEL